MYNTKLATRTTLNVNKSYVGETIEQKINRIVNNKEPIKDGAPLIYSDRKDGVKPQYDIRTDRWEVAVEAMDKVSKSYAARRDHKIGEESKKNQEFEKKTETKTDGGAEPTQATETK